MIYIILILAGVLCGISIYLLIKAKNIKVQKNQQQEQINKLIEQIKDLQYQFQEKRNELKTLNAIIQERNKEADKIYEIEVKQVRAKVDDFKRVTDEAANSYIDTLEKDYQAAEAAHKQQIASLQAEYNEAAAALQKIKETRQAAFESLLKQKELKAKKDNYRLIPSHNDLDDIYTLENIRKGLHKPRILSMLIWQTFWQPLAKEKFPVILQAKTTTGIYKITNTVTNQCYIGQSVDIYKRWCDHCKAGLGIDTPVGNKLYKAIESQGLENFTFELLCKCDKEDLNEKEKYFIQLYQADTFGYNGTGGNK